MQTQPWHHEHDFTLIHDKGERRTRVVLWLTIVMMVIEIVTGTLFGSMALLADGWHMGTHVAAFGITLFAYAYTRRHKDDPAYAFGTGKVGVLGGFASSIALLVVALVMLVESLGRLFEPHTILFDEAIAVAFLGLAVNLASAVLLGHHHDHDHGHHHHHDHNLRGAYLHVIADALTSVLAIVALMAGKHFGWHWMDALMGIVGAVIISRWGLGLIRETAPLLLDASIDAEVKAQIVAVIDEDPQTEITDLHVWRVGPAHYALILCIVTDTPRTAAHYKSLLAPFPQVAHATVEVHTRP